MKIRASSINSEIAEWERRKEVSASAFDPSEFHRQIVALFGDLRTILANNCFDNKLLKQLIDEITVDEVSQIEIKFRALKDFRFFLRHFMNRLNSRFFFMEIIRATNGSCL